MGYSIDPINPPLDPSTGAFTTTHTVNAPNWRITKTVVPTPTVEPGDPLTYTLLIENDGHLVTSGTYTITDVIPDDTDFVSANLGGVYSDPIRTVIWSFSDPLTDTNSFSVTYTVAVTLPLNDGTLIVNDDYRVTGGNVYSDGVGSPVTVTVRTPVTLTLTKLDGPDPVPAGEIIDYLLTVTNDPASKGPATDVIVTDTIPANTSFLGAGFIGPINGTITPGPTMTNPLYVTWALSSPLTIGSSVNMTMSVVVTSPLPNGTLINNNYEGSTSNVISAVVVDPLPVTTTVVSTPTLNLTKVGNPFTVNAGDTLTYTIAYSNSGNANATGTIITDELDSSVVYSSSVPPGSHDGSPSGGVVTWNIGPVAGEGAESGLLTVTVVVTSPLPNDTIITNTANITANEGVTNTAVTTNIVNSTPNFQLTKSVVPTPTVQAGEFLTYTLDLLNVGNANAVDAVLTDVIPFNTQFVTATAGFSPTNPVPGDPLTWPISTVVVGVPQQYVLVVQVDSPLDNGTLITNSAVISSPLDRADSNVVTTTVESTPTLEIFKVGLPEPVSAGGLITYTIIYTNSGNMDASGVVITDIFPANTSFNSDDSNPLVAGTTITGGRQWTVGPLAGEGGTGVITLTLNVAAPQDNGTILTNTVTIAGDQPSTDTTEATNTITSTPILDITKIESEDPIKAGNQLIYTITYTNTGNMNASGVTISDIYDGPFAAIDASPPGVVTPSPLPAQITWNLASVPADASPRTQVMTVTLPGSVQDNSIITNTVSITSAQNVGDGETITTTVTGLKTDLQIDKARNGSGDVISGEQISYTITITNAGPDTVNATITDTFSAAEATFVSCAPSANCSGGPPVVWTLNGFTGTQTLSLVIDTNDTFSGTLTNDVTITPTSSLDEDTDPGNNDDSVDTPVRYPMADLAITKTRQGSGEIIAGDTISYRIDITNNGPDIVNAVITDTFDPSEATFVSCGTPTSCTVAGPGVLTWNVSNLGLGTTLLDFVTVRTSTSFSGTFTNTVTITGTAPLGVDPDPDNNTDTIGLPVRLPIANLQISKVRNGSGEVLAGDPISYTITITNAGGDTVDAVITDTFNTGEASFSGCSDGCTGSGPVVWNISSFTNTRTLQLDLQASASFSGTLVNDAVISFTVPSVDPDFNDNQDSESTPVRYPFADLQIVKETTAISAEAGTLINYTITITNAGPDPADVVITDTFSPSSAATVFDCSDSCGANPVTWSFNDFIGSRTLSLVLKTSSGFSGTLANTAEIGFAGIGIDNNGGNETDAVSVPVIIVPKFIYLPIVLKNFPAPPTATPTPIVSVTPSATPVLPTPTPGGPTLTPTPTATPTPQGDLVITGFSINPANPSSTDNVVVSITIQNQGTQSTGEGFWVDFYVNPQTLPNDPGLGRDRRWSNTSINSSQGIAWPISTPLGPGQSITLTSDGSAGPPFDSGQTVWSGQLGPGVIALYAFADSFDANDPTGPTNVELVETNETNNMAGPINLNIGSKEGEVDTNDAPEATPEPLAPRPDLGAGSE